MAKTLVARGQATIHIQKDGYTISQSLGEYVFPADADGKILSAVSVTSTIKVTLGDSEFTGFSIGTVAKPAGFSSVSVNNSNKTVTYTVAAETATLADHGMLTIPISYRGSPIRSRSSGQRPVPVSQARTVPTAPCSTGSRSGTRERRSSTTIRSSPRSCSREPGTETGRFPVSPSVHSRFPSGTFLVR